MHNKLESNLRNSLPQLDFFEQVSEVSSNWLNSCVQDSFAAEIYQISFHSYTGQHLVFLLTQGNNITLAEILPFLVGLTHFTFWVYFTLNPFVVNTFL